MATPAEILEAIAPELADVDSDRLTVVLDVAEALTSTSIYGNEAIRNQAVALRAAHMLTLGNMAATASNVTSETVGPLSISYDTSAAALASTRYGAELAALNRAYTFAPRTRVQTLVAE